MGKMARKYGRTSCTFDQEMRKNPPRGKSEIRTGDAFRLIDEVPSSSVDLILTSPPYWGLRTYRLRHQEDTLDRWLAEGCDERRIPPYEWYRRAGGQLGLEPYPSWYVAHLVEFFSRARRTLKVEGSLWINLGDTYFARWSSIRDAGQQGLKDGRLRRRGPSGGYLHDKQLLLIPARFAIEMQEQGWILRNDLIWAKPNPLPRPERDRLRSAHEHWFHFVHRNSRRPTYFYDLEACEQGATDVVVCDTEPGFGGHTATFPSELVRRRIASSCAPRGLVLDPFCGTGTAVIEALRTGRRGIGFELSSDYARKARGRLAARMEFNGNGSRISRQRKPAGHRDS